MKISVKINEGNGPKNLLRVSPEALRSSVRRAISGQDPNLLRFISSRVKKSNPKGWSRLFTTKIENPDLGDSGKVKKINPYPQEPQNIPTDTNVTPTQEVGSMVGKGFQLIEPPNVDPDKEIVTLNRQINRAKFNSLLNKYGIDPAIGRLRVRIARHRLKGNT